ncbi:PRP38 family-domain-containing protein [Syncephalis plumigaleata]|nr:PRP38 family-domain-containing protein [Syncephalis plumigaleata]
MADTTQPEVISVHGTNPQFLVEKIIRSRIYDSMYWKEHCFALTAESLIDKAVDLEYIGGQYANIRPTEFLCLTLKLLQIQPEKEIILEYLMNEDFKYLTALAAFYLRLVGNSVEIYRHLEPLLADYRKLRHILFLGGFDLICMDELIDALLHEERVCDIILPRLQKRHVLEEMGDLEPRVSPLADELEAEEEAAAEAERKRLREIEREKDRLREAKRQEEQNTRSNDEQRRTTRSRSRSRDRHQHHHRSSHHHHRSHHHRRHSRDRDHDEKERSRPSERSRSRSRTRHHRHHSSRSYSRDRRE